MLCLEAPGGGAGNPEGGCERQRIDKKGSVSAPHPAIATTKFSVLLPARIMRKR